MNTTEHKIEKVLITGGLGFIGFNMLQFLKKTQPDWKLFVVDNITYAARFMLDEKQKWCRENDVEVFTIDIADPTSYNLPSESPDKNQLKCIIQTYHIDTIINFAAESHVDNSIADASPFFRTNILGTVNLLELAKNFDLRFHQISTDEVYGSTVREDNIDVNSTLKPSSPYSSSKASADLIALSYFKTFGTRVTVSRCSNNFGRWQHPEKLIPTICSKLFNHEKIPVYGDGQQKRQWIYVDDHNFAVTEILKYGELGKIYNISSNDIGYCTNLDMIESLIPNFKEGQKIDDFIEHVKDRPGHDVSYYIYNYLPIYVDGEEFVELTRRHEQLLADTRDWYFSVFEKEKKSKEENK